MKLCLALTNPTRGGGAHLLLERRYCGETSWGGGGGGGGVQVRQLHYSLRDLSDLLGTGL